MIQNKNSTCATNSSKAQWARWTWWVQRAQGAVWTWRALGLLTVIAAGFLLRTQRLDWQPLWWDEGISVYFATESLGRMLWLTAHDIHPPAYYALLHGWAQLLQSARPPVLRLFSVGVGLLTLPLQFWLARTLFPGQPRLALLGVLLLAVNPLHIFYSQEVRMYALALALGIASTAFLWILVRTAGEAPDATEDATPHDNEPPRRMRGGRRHIPLASWIGYTVTLCLALYTLYYLAWLYVAHAAWALWHLRRRLRMLGGLLGAYVAAGVIYAPWLWYTSAKLVRYVDDKVAADNDTPLNVLQYLTRHLLAFTVGHVSPVAPHWQWVRFVGFGVAIGAVALLLIATLRRRRPAQPASVNPNPVTALWFFVLIPGGIGFLLNLNLPFFPAGGERLLLYVLPYGLLLLACAIDRHWTWRAGRPALIGLLTCALIGIGIYYTVPRYSERDYRPLIAHMVQNGTDRDTVLTLFPWQVGYWRAYAPFSVRAATQAGPHPILLGEGSLTWNESIAAQIDAALREDTLWFPAPLGFGSDLPRQIEHYLQERAQPTNGAPTLLNVELDWYNATTRVSAWTRLSAPQQQPVNADFGTLHLTAAGAAPIRVESANTVLHVALTWQSPVGAAPGTPDQMRHITLRLQDDAGRVWSSRSYALEPASVARVATNTNMAEPAGQTMYIGLRVPAGVPPGAHIITLSLSTVESGASNAEPVETPAVRALRARLADHSERESVPVAQVEITQPAAALPAFRLPIGTPLPQPARHDGIALLGHSGPDATAHTLAGTDLDVTLFYQNQRVNPPLRHLYLSVLDARGAGVAGWEGWPLPAYPTTAWPAGALVRVPATFNLPATLPGGAYALITGLIDPTTGQKSEPTALGTIHVRQRNAQFEAPIMQHPLEQPVQFGTHVQLIGYTLPDRANSDGAEDGGTVELRLHWRVLQPIVPTHHIFVHLDEPGATGPPQAQADGPPRGVTATGTTPAPTGSWQPDEYLTTVHQLALPAALAAGVQIDREAGTVTGAGQPLVFRVGLYVPETGVRLPTFIADEASGDAAQLPALR